MNVGHPIKLGWRYLFGRRLSNGVTRAATAGISVGTAAMIIVLSAFNGLEKLIKSSFEDIHPSAEIFFENGGRFLPDSSLINKLNDTHFDWFPVLEQKAVIQTSQNEILVDIKGIPFQNLESFIWLDSLTSKLSTEPVRESIWLGSGVARQLGFSDLNGLETIQLYWPQNPEMGFIGMEPLLNKKSLSPYGIFQTNSKIDNTNVLVFLNSLNGWGKDHRWTSIQIWNSKKETIQMDYAAEEIRALLKDFPYIIKDPKDQEKAVFRVMESEGLITSAILGFIVLLASLGLYSSIILTGLERESQSAILSALGFPKNKIQQSFFWNGTWISVLGATIGFLISLLAVGIQTRFGLIKLGEGYIIEAYPVQFSLLQSIEVCVFVIAIGTALSFIASKKVSIDTLKLREKA